jgi:hypothetical protein
MPTYLKPVEPNPYRPSPTLTDRAPRLSPQPHAPSSLSPNPAPPPPLTRRHRTLPQPRLLPDPAPSPPWRSHDRVNPARPRPRPARIPQAQIPGDLRRPPASSSPATSDVLVPGDLILTQRWASPSSDLVPKMKFLAYPGTWGCGRPPVACLPLASRVDCKSRQLLEQATGGLSLN